MAPPRTKAASQTPAAAAAPQAAVGARHPLPQEELQAAEDGGGGGSGRGGKRTVQSRPHCKLVSLEFRMRRAATFLVRTSKVKILLKKLDMGKR